MGILDALKNIYGMEGARSERDLCHRFGKVAMKPDMAGTGSLAAAL
jgi:hypothetical protein